MGAPDTVAARQAALLVHGLDAAARGQVLGRLDASQAARLGVLLEELDGLGWSRGRGPGPAPVRAGARAAPAALAPQDRVARLRAEDVARALAGCSTWTVARLLSVREWPWRAQVLERLAPARRHEVRDALRAGAAPVPPGLAAALCECLLREASPTEAGREAPAPVAAARRAWHALRGAVKSALGGRRAWIR
jgi:hypothetical protein